MVGGRVWVWEGGGGRPGQSKHLRRQQKNQDRPASRSPLHGELLLRGCGGVYVLHARAARRQRVTGPHTRGGLAPPTCAEMAAAVRGALSLPRTRRSHARRLPARADYWSLTSPGGCAGTPQAARVTRRTVPATGSIGSQFGLRCSSARRAEWKTSPHETSDLASSVSVSPKETADALAPAPSLDARIEHARGGNRRGGSGCRSRRELNSAGEIACSRCAEYKAFSEFS